MALTKAEIIESIHDQLGLPKKNCADLFETLLEIIKSTLANGEDVLISGFGKLCVKEKKDRKILCVSFHTSRSFSSHWFYYFQIWELRTT